MLQGQRKQLPISKKIAENENASASPIGLEVEATVPDSVLLVPDQHFPSVLTTDDKGQSHPDGKILIENNLKKGKVELVIFASIKAT